MADVRVVEDGVEATRSSTRPAGAWVLPLAGFLVGLGLGIVVVGAAPSPSPVVTEAGDLGAPAQRGASATGEIAGLAEVVPDFPDAIVAITATSGTGLDHLIWAPIGAPTTRSMTGAARADFDATAQVIALIDHLPAGQGAVLSMGRFNTLEPVASGVTSHAWHDARGDLLAYTTEEEPSTTLYVARSGSTPVLAIDRLSMGSAVAAWGDWGWAIQETTGNLRLLTAEGVFRDSEPGVAYASHPSGWLFVVDGGQAKLVSAGGGVRRLDFDVGIGSVDVAEFSPDGNMVAVGGDGGSVVIRPESDAVVVLGQSNPTWLTWSSDSRFVLAGAESGLVVHDLATGASYPVLRSREIVAAGSIEARSS